MIDWTKPIETTDGEPCTYLGEFNDGYVWIAYRSDELKNWGAIKVLLNGYVPHLNFRIRNVIEKGRLEGWMNVFVEGGVFYKRKGTADFAAHEGRIACVKIDQEYTVGEGLE